MDQFREQEYIALQNELAAKIVLERNFDDADIQRVAGIDLAYWDEGGRKLAVCVAAVVDRRSKSVIELRHHVGEVTVPYVPGFLSFRELPLVVKTFRTLQTEPDLFMFDGNRVLHSRKMGIAAHASFCLNKPTIGVAKTYFKVGDTDFVMRAPRKVRTPTSRSAARCSAECCALVRT